MKTKKHAEAQAQIAQLTRRFTLLTVEMNNLPALPDSHPRATTIQAELRAIKGRIQELNDQVVKSEGAR